MSRTPRPQTRVASDFSIARILAEDSREKKLLRASVFAGSRVERESFPGSHQREYKHAIDSLAFHASHACRWTTEDDPRDKRTTATGNSPERPEVAAARHERAELTWLKCTRYRPPKIPRKPATGKSGKRRPGAYPRIPFTATQLQVLEEKYRRTAYLSRRDVIQLSTALRLPQSRVKIWFQNRRARDRRESTASNATILSADLTTPGDKSKAATDGGTTTAPSPEINGRLLRNSATLGAECE